jgi:hypothetical protein
MPASVFLHAPQVMDRVDVGLASAVAREVEFSRSAGHPHIVQLLDSAILVGISSSSNSNSSMASSSCCNGGMDEGHGGNGASQNLVLVVRFIAFEKK